MVKALLLPSWLSGGLAILTGLALSIGVILFHKLDPGHVYQQLLTLRSAPAQPVLTVPGQSVPQLSNSLQTTWPLLAFWGLVGLAIYFVFETMVKLVNDAKQIREGLDYVNSQPHQLIRTTVEYLLLRLIGAVLWLLSFDVFLKTIIPYAISLSSDAETAKLSKAIPDLIGIFALTAFLIHLQAVFVRLAFRRVRVLSNTAYLTGHNLS